MSSDPLLPSMCATVLSMFGKSQLYPETWLMVGLDSSLLNNTSLFLEKWNKRVKDLIGKSLDILFYFLKAVVLRTLSAGSLVVGFIPHWLDQTSWNAQIIQWTQTEVLPTQYTWGLFQQRFFSSSFVTSFCGCFTTKWIYVPLLRSMSQDSCIKSILPPCIFWLMPTNTSSQKWVEIVTSLTFYSWGNLKITNNIKS